MSKRSNGIHLLISTTQEQLRYGRCAKVNRYGRSKKRKLIDKWHSNGSNSRERRRFMALGRLGHQSCANVNELDKSRSGSV